MKKEKSSCCVVVVVVGNRETPFLADPHHYVICHMSYVKCHMSYAMCHALQLANENQEGSIDNEANF